MYSPNQSPHGRIEDKQVVLFHLDPPQQLVARLDRDGFGLEGAEGRVELEAARDPRDDRLRLRC